MPNSKQAEHLLQELNSRLSEWLAENDTPCLERPLSHQSLAKTSDLALPIEGLGLENLFSDVDFFLSGSVKTNSKRFMNPLWGGIDISSMIGEIISTLANTSMYTFELSPFGTLIEKTLIEKVCSVVGFESGGGTFTTGGSNGNMLGMLCGRHSIDPNIMREGNRGAELVAYVSAESHYSVQMAANVLGIGLSNVIKVNCDEDGRMRPDSLIQEIRRSRNEGRRPFCVIATSGTTVRGAFDPLRAISEICTDEGLWMHVDAAWGGTSLLSNKYRHLMDGVEFADSVCWDAHKMMGVPLICSIFVIKDAALLRRVCSHTGIAHYLFHDDTEVVDLGRSSLQCGRRNDALKLWLAWREKGDAGWAKMVDRYIGIADKLQDMVESDNRLEMMSSRVWSNVCFRVKADDPNRFNTELRERILRNGKFMISRSNIGDDVILRPVISNPSVDEDSLNELISEIHQVADEILEE